MRRLYVLSAISLNSAFSHRMSTSLRMSYVPSSYNTLFVATTTDTASMNIASALRDSSSTWNSNLSNEKSSIFWTKSDAPSSELSSSGESESRIVWLWIQDQQLLHMNSPDRLFNQELSCAPSPERSLDDVKFDEVIFLSKHCAASGKASLTVHPIGIPWMAEAGQSGGLPGRCSPPNRRIAELYRALLAETKLRGMHDQFEVTLEATHHGPHVDLPTCFVEIGSSETEWSIPEAGLIWAECLMKHFGIRHGADESTENSPTLDIPSSSSSSSSSSRSSINRVLPSVTDGGVVMVTIGGGHYVPKMNDAARFGNGMYTGHSLTTYALQRHLDGSERAPVEGGWKHIVKEALESTRITHPRAKLIVLLDKKAFIAEYKNNIIEYLTELDVKWTHKVSDVKILWESTILQSVESVSTV